MRHISFTGPREPEFTWTERLANQGKPQRVILKIAVDKPALANMPFSMEHKGLVEKLYSSSL